MLTGESIPVEKNPGSSVIGASINKNGTIKFRAEKIGSYTVISQIIKLVEDAQGAKAHIAKLADIISGYFVPVVVADIFKENSTKAIKKLHKMGIEVVMAFSSTYVLLNAIRLKRFKVEK